MGDRTFFLLTAFAALAMIALALVWPRGSDTSPTVQVGRPAPAQAEAPASAPGRRRSRLPFLFAVGETSSDAGPRRRRLRGPGHRTCPFPHGIFRPVRTSRAVRGDDHRQPQ